MYKYIQMHVYAVFIYKGMLLFVDEHNELRTNERRGLPLVFYLYISNTSSTLNAVILRFRSKYTPNRLQGRNIDGSTHLWYLF